MLFNDVCAEWTLCFFSPVVGEVEDAIGLIGFTGVKGYLNVLSGTNELVVLGVLMYLLSWSLTGILLKIWEEERKLEEDWDKGDLQCDLR